MRKTMMMTAILLATMHCSLTTAFGQTLREDGAWNGIRAVGKIVPGEAAVFADQSGRFVRSASATNMTSAGNQPAFATTNWVGQQLAGATAPLARSADVAAAVEAEATARAAGDAAGSNRVAEAVAPLATTNRVAEMIAASTNALYAKPQALEAEVPLGGAVSLAERERGQDIIVTLTPAAEGAGSRVTLAFSHASAPRDGELVALIVRNGTGAGISQIDISVQPMDGGGMAGGGIAAGGAAAYLFTPLTWPSSYRTVAFTRLN